MIFQNNSWNICLTRFLIYGHIGEDEKTAPGRAAHTHDGSHTLPRFTDNVTNLSCFQFSFSLGPKLFRIQLNTKLSSVSSSHCWQKSRPKETHCHK